MPGSTNQRDPRGARGENLSASTNALDMDIAAIEDANLRRRIAAAFHRLRARAEYGLVFEKHKPESVVLHGQEVREDRYATLRSSPGPRNAFRVVGIDGDKARLQPVDEHFRPNGDETTESLGALVPLARFGSPIFPGLMPNGEALGAVDEDGKPTKPFHTVINGENFHALETLLYACEGQIDAIYIDPPYNSGASDWKYNNDYVDKEDRYRHSLWLSFMEKRLKLAQRLLRPDDSVLIVTIDEKEYLRLGLLLEQTFPGSKIQMVTTVTKPGGTSRTKEFSRVDEYIYFVFMGQAELVRTDDNMLAAPDDEPLEPKGLTESDLWEGMIRRGIGVVRSQRQKQFYPIFIDEERRRIVEWGDPVGKGVDRSTVPDRPGLRTVWPIKDDLTEGFWQLGHDGLAKARARGTVRVGSFNKKTGQWRIQYMKAKKAKAVEDGTVATLGKDENGVVILDLGDSQLSGLSTPRTVWNKRSHDASTGGAGLLNKFLPGQKFPFPKSLYAVEDCLRFFTADKPDALIVDFFCGSGTTAHAVMRLNRQLGGHRRTILVTNNEVSAEEQAHLRSQGLQPGDTGWEEHGIFEHITKPRVTAAITGMTPKGEPIEGEYKFVDEFSIQDGFEENVRFFNLTYLDPETVEAKQAFGQVAHLLWLIGGAEGPVIEKESRSGWALPDGATYGVLFRNKGRAAFAEALKARTEAGEPPRHLFVVSDSTDEFHRSLEEVGADPAHTTRLYRHYLKNFRTNVTDLKGEL